MQIVPIENIQGRKAVEGGDMCLRKTTNGVDLNRNWGYAWAKVRTGACNSHITSSQGTCHYLILKVAYPKNCMMLLLAGEGTSMGGVTLPHNNMAMRQHLDKGAAELPRNVKHDYAFGCILSRLRMVVRSTEGQSLSASQRLAL